MVFSANHQEKCISNKRNVIFILAPSGGGGSGSGTGATQCSPGSSPTKPSHSQSAQASPTNTLRPWRPRARSADESSKKVGVSEVVMTELFFFFFF
jgi:hypothetical protein